MINESSGVRLVSDHKGLSALLGRPVDILDFSGTVTGTHKIFKAQKAFNRFPDAPGFIAITSGNYGAALKYVAEKEARRTVHVIMGLDKEELAYQLQGPFTQAHALEELQHCLTFMGGRDPRLIPFPVSTGFSCLLGDDLVSAYRVHAREAHNVRGVPAPVNITGNQDIYGVRPKRSELVYLLDSSLVRLRDYDTVVVPTGSGELLHDITKQGFSGQKVLGITPKGHPLVTHKPFDDSVQDSIADKLVTPTAPMSSSLSYLKSHRRNIVLVNASDDEFREAHRIALDAGFSVEPSGAAAFVAGVKSFRERNDDEYSGSFLSRRVLLVSTGDGNKAFSGGVL